jgi:hypothetical protein
MSVQLAVFAIEPDSRHLLGRLSGIQTSVLAASAVDVAEPGRGLMYRHQVATIIAATSQMSADHHHRIGTA